MKKQFFFVIFFAIMLSITSASYVCAAILSPEDAEFLVRSVAAEYGDMPYAARVGVVAVIMNRVESEEYPGSATGVIVTYRNADGSLRFNKKSLQASDRALRMTQDAYFSVINGGDITGGALSFEFVEQIPRKLDFDFDDHSEDKYAREMQTKYKKYKLAIDGVGFW